MQTNKNVNFQFLLSVTEDSRLAYVCETSCAGPFSCRVRVAGMFDDEEFFLFRSEIFFIHVVASETDDHFSSRRAPL